VAVGDQRADTERGIDGLHRHGSGGRPGSELPANLLSDAAGRIICDLKFDGKLGGPATATNQCWRRHRVFYTKVVVKAGPPAKMLIVAGNSQSGTSGQKLPTLPLRPGFRLWGNLLAGVPVSWEVVQPGTLTLSNAQLATDANGRARPKLLLARRQA